MPRKIKFLALLFFQNCQVCESKRFATQVRKTRMMGSAALAMAYIACGRLDAYIESRISLWDIAAGKLLVEAAGGKVDLSPSPGHADSWSIVTTNGKIPIEEIL